MRGFLKSLILLAEKRLGFEISVTRDGTIGVNLSTVYRAIKFSATISDWETTIYENNDDF